MFQLVEYPVKKLLDLLFFILFFKIFSFSARLRNVFLALQFVLSYHVKNKIIIMRRTTIICSFLLASFVLPHTHVRMQAQPLAEQPASETIRVEVRLKMKSDEFWYFDEATCTVGNQKPAVTETLTPEKYAVLTVENVPVGKAHEVEVNASLADLEFNRREVFAHINCSLPQTLRRDTIINLDLNELVPVTVTATLSGLSKGILLLGNSRSDKLWSMSFASDQMYLLLPSGQYACSLDAQMQSGEAVRTRFQNFEVSAAPQNLNLKAKASDFHRVSFKSLNLPDSYLPPFYQVVDGRFYSGESLEKGSYCLLADLADTNPDLLTLLRKEDFTVGDTDVSVTLDYRDYVSLPVEVLVDEAMKFQPLTYRISDGTETGVVEGYPAVREKLKACLLSHKTYTLEVLSTSGEVLKKQEFRVDDSLSKITVDLRDLGATVGVASLAQSGNTLAVEAVAGRLQVKAPQSAGPVQVEIYSAAGAFVQRAVVSAGGSISLSALKKGLYLVRLKQGKNHRVQKLVFSPDNADRR